MRTDGVFTAQPPFVLRIFSSAKMSNQATFVSDSQISSTFDSNVAAPTYVVVKVVKLWVDDHFLHGKFLLPFSIRVIDGTLSQKHRQILGSGINSKQRVDMQKEVSKRLE